VIRLATNQGEVVIEVNDPDTEVTLREGGAVIQDRKGQRRVTLAAGQHELEVAVQDADGEVRFFTTNFLLRRGGKEIVNVRQELARAPTAIPKPAKTEARAPNPPAKTVGAERQAALWALSQGGTGELLHGNEQTAFLSVSDLPDETFQVVKLELGVHARPTDTSMKPLEELSHLQSLKLQGSWVNDATLLHLKPLHELRRLDLIATQVGDAGLLELQGLTNLEHLTVGTAPVTDAGLAYLQALPNLRTFELSATRVTELGMEKLAAFPSLTGRLEVGGPSVTDAWLARLPPLNRLTSLGLANTSVTDAGLANLPSLANLQELNLSYTKVGNAGLIHLLPLRKLRGLQLAGTNVSDAGLAQLRQLKNLSVLNLRGTRVTDACLADLVALLRSSPYRVLLRHTRISAWGFAELQQTLPKADIEWSEPNHTAAEAVLALGGTVHVRPPAHPMTGSFGSQRTCQKSTSD